MFRSVFRFHIIPIIISVILTVFVVVIVSVYPREALINERIELEGTQMSHRSFILNSLGGEQSEIELIASIKNPEQLTIFGSSEFSNSPYASFLFLPDSLGHQAFGYGHAYHQNFSILLELLAANEFLDSSDICIVLSPGWFETEGTNVQAFVEFARPNFLNKIYLDPKINDKYKEHIGRYIDNHYKDLNGISISMGKFRSMYIERNSDILGRQLHNLQQALTPEREVVETNYKVSVLDKKLTRIWDKDYSIAKKKLQKEFISNINSNNIYVSDEYFDKYLSNGDGTFNMGKMKSIALEKSEEYLDLLLVLELLKERNVNASFVMQTLNPFYYEGMRSNQLAINQIVDKIEEYQFNCFNMYEADVEMYEPGTLKDVMHLGDFGWMSINEFLVSVYYE